MSGKPENHSVKPERIAVMSEDSFNTASCAISQAKAILNLVTFSMQDGSDEGEAIHAVKGLLDTAWGVFCAPDSRIIDKPAAGQS